MLNSKWFKNDVKKFLDDNNTIFEYGTYKVNGEKFEYKFIDDKGNEDYCTVKQMFDWKVQLVKKLG